ncbi:helix-turn-helix domain-containing protein [Treponema sp. R80B11-R83G3]
MGAHAPPCKKKKPFALLENVLLDIEEGIKKNITAFTLSKKYSLSEIHLRRLFKFAFNKAISGYIRSRTLAESLNDILHTDKNIIDIALEYGFGYENSYSRSFRREFGISPDNLRKTRQIIKIQPPLHLFDENNLDDNAFFGPEFVVVPQFHLIGKTHKLSFENALKEVYNAGKLFWENDRQRVKNIINPDVYFGFTHNINHEKKYSEFLTSVQVRNLSDIPPGLSGATFNTSMCARFRFIGQHQYNDINIETANKMYGIIRKYINDDKFNYSLSMDKVYFERIDFKKYNGDFFQLECYTPATEKSA